MNFPKPAICANCVDYVEGYCMDKKRAVTRTYCCVSFGETGTRRSTQEKDDEYELE